jgi:hypothetical protein
LRRYLRQKRLQMPAAMTGMWLTVGGTLVVGLLLVGAFLPRPYSEYPLLDVLDRAGSVKRQANRLAFKGDSPAEGKGQPGAGKPDGKGGADGKTGEKGQGEGKDGKDGKGEGKDGKGGKGGKGSNSSSSGKSQGEKGDGKGEQGKGEQGKGEQGKSGEQGKGEQGKGEQGKGGEKGKGEQGDKQDKGGRSGRSDPGNTAKGMKNMEKAQQGGGSSSSSQSRMAQVQQILQRVGPVLKWIVFAVLALLVLVAVLRGGLGFLANFTDWAKRLLEAWRRFWANLFGGTQAQQTGGDVPEGPRPAKQRAVPFSAFRNPFDSGEADRMTLRNLVRYSFAALEAWAREHNLGRGEDETGLEFIRRLSEEIPALEAAANELAGLHAEAEYARERLPDNTQQRMQAFWERLERVVEAPLSA